MAKQVITKLLDDLDGGQADETLSFALDGNGYEIDLSSKNAKKVRDFLDAYIQAGTRTGRVGSGAQLQRARPTSHMATVAQNKELNAAIREWAISNGYELAERGRIPTHIQDAYSNKKPNPDRIAKPEPEANTEAKKSAPRKPNGSTVVNFKRGSKVS